MASAPNAANNGSNVNNSSSDGGSSGFSSDGGSPQRRPLAHVEEEEEPSFHSEDADEERELDRMQAQIPNRDDEEVEGETDLDESRPLALVVEKQAIPQPQHDSGHEEDSAGSGSASPQHHQTLHLQQQLAQGLLAAVLLLLYELVQLFAGELCVVNGKPLRATFDALKQLESVEQYATRLGRDVEEILPNYTVRRLGGR